MAEQKDTLRSKATLTILDLLGEGQIGGLVNGDRSVFFNETQLQNDDGTYNFSGVTTFSTNGSNGQGALSGFGNYIETPYNVSVQVKKTTPYTFAISNPMADALRVIVNIPGLSETKSDTGDIVGYSVVYKFQMSIDGGPFNDVVTGTAWTGSGTWSTSGTTKIATAEANSYGTRASVTASVNTAVRSFGYVKVQPQEYDGSKWVNLGAVRTITTYGSTGDVVTVESKYSQIRFVATETGVGTSLVAGTIGAAMSTGEIKISGKSRSKYQRKHMLAIPRPANTVEVRMVRISDDAATAYIANETWLDSYYEIVSLNMSYPNSALFGFTADSAQFNQIPQRAYLVDGLLIQVPSNYDPATRTYTGVWNGFFKTAVSNNPAWVMYDLLTNKRYGLGNFLGATQVDKAMLYTIGRYCDELVPDGFGGYEPRFTLNTVISSRQEAYKVISDIASVFRGMTYWAGGMACFTQDAPADPVMIYGRANVIEGMFTYSGSARKDRHSVVHVTWNDPADNYKKKVEYVEDAELIKLYGIRKLDTLAFGTTSRGQAARVGKWILYTEKYESDFISFKVGIDSAFVQPGNIVKIQDPTRAGKRSAGRLISATPTSATLDAPITIDSSASVSIMMPDGTFVDRTLLQMPGTYTEISWSAPLGMLPEANAMWLVQEEVLVPILARVVSVSQISATEFELTALEHNPSKYAAIEQGLVLQERNTSIVDPSFVHTPTALTVTEGIYLTPSKTVANKMLISWSGDCTAYDLTYQGVSSGNASNPVKVRVDDAMTYEVTDALLGAYQITITGINPLGKRSATVSTSYTVTGKLTPPSDVEQVNVGVSMQGILLEWTPVSDIDLKAYEVRACDYVGQEWGEADFVAQTSPVTTSLLLPLNVSGTYQWMVRAINLTDKYSAVEARGTLTIGVPSTPVVSAIVTQGNCKLNWTSSQSGLPIEQYEVRVGSNWASGAAVGRVTAETLTIPVTWGGSQTFWVQGTDIAGNVSEPGSVVASITSPSVSNLAVAIVDGRYRLTWTGIQASLPITGYKIRIGDSAATWASATFVTDTAASSYEGKIDFSGAKKFFVVSVDSAGNVSNASSVTLTVGVPTAPVMTSAISSTNLTLSWATPALGSLPLDGYELRAGAGTFASAALVSQLKGNSITLPITWVGDQTFQVVAKDVAGNVSAVGSKVVSIVAPATPVPAGSFLADTFTLAWGAPTSTLPIAEYEIRYGATWATGAASAIRVKATIFSISAQWTGTRRWWVAAIDANGNIGSAGQVDVTINAPSAPVMTRKVVDNNVLLYWSESTGTLPVPTYELRRGDTYATATVIGKKSGGFTTIFETASGTYTYWLVGVDSAGNYGTPSSLAVTVDQPPDYILKANDDLDFSGTKVNMALDTDGSYIMPVNTTETFAQHFTTRSWTSPDSQINAGYPVFIEPANSPGYYEQIIDYGAVLPSTKIVATISGAVVAGAPVRSVQISLRKTTSDPWTDYLSDTVYAGDFRYLKIRFTVSGGGTDLYRLAGINVKLDSKIRSDAGMATAGAADSVSGASAVINGVTVANANPYNANGVRVPDGAGTLVRFSTNFIDVSSIEITLASGSAAAYGLYDFVDAPYAAGFKVVLYDKSGNRVGGSFSWGAKGV